MNAEILKFVGDVEAAVRTGIAQGIKLVSGTFNVYYDIRERGWVISTARIQEPCCCPIGMLLMSLQLRPPVDNEETGLVELLASYYNMDWQVIEAYWRGFDDVQGNRRALFTEHVEVYESAQQIRKDFGDAILPAPRP